MVARAAIAIRLISVDALQTRSKADASPVTAADEAAERIIVCDLRKLLPGTPVISEEAWGRGARPDLKDTFVLVDPLDGTRDFLAGESEYTVNIAIITDGKPFLGIVAAPALGVVWRGLAGRRAERLALDPADASTPTAIHARARPAGGYTALVSRSHFDPRTAAFLATVPVTSTVRCASSLKFCRLAEGVADLYPRLGPTSEWDIAAGHAVLLAAGGIMTAPDGAPLIYGNHKDGFRVPGFIASGDPASHPAETRPTARDRPAGDP